MKILAIELSSPERSVAAVCAEAGTIPAVSFEVLERGGHGTRALSMVEEALAGAQVAREQIDTIVIGLGPGSYTGIRSAIALAQGWQLARGVRLLGISSAECVAEQARAEGIGGKVAVVIDAQRGEFYLALYHLEALGSRELQKLKLASRAEVEAAEAYGHLLVGPEVGRWFAKGRTVCPRAALLGQLALTRTDAVPGEKLEPVYLRETTFVKAPPP